MAGLFVTLEGIDGVGKSTVAKHVCLKLMSHDVNAIVEAEPTRTKLGQLAWQAVVEGLGYDDTTTALLFAADRIEHAKLIAQMVRRFDVVICDRYKHSSFAYQGSWQHLAFGSVGPFDWIKTINAAAPDPDLAIVLEIPIEVAKQRAAARNGKRDPDWATIERAAQRYRQMAEANWLTPVDASRPLEDVVSDVFGIIMAKRASVSG